MTRRPRRTLPAALVALALLAVGALAATSAVQTLLGRAPVVGLDVVPAALSGVAWQSPAVLAGAGVAGLVGAVLLLAAVLPGRSHVLPAAVDPTDPDGAEAGWHRSDLARRLRYRAEALDGVSGATVTVRRRRVRVKARTGRGATDEVRDAVSSALTADLASLGLVRTPRLRLSVSSSRKER